MRLLSRNQVPAVSAHNRYILRGYRPVTASLTLSVRSLACLHLELVNIFTHLIPAILLSALPYHLYWHMAVRFPNAALADEVILRSYLTTSVMYLGVSSMYHMLLCHSERCSGFWSCLDYVAIIIQIVSSFVSRIYLGFYCEPHLQKAYWTLVSVLCCATGVVLLNQRFQNSRWRSTRIGIFIAIGLSAFAPILHAVHIFPYAQLDKQAGLSYYTEGSVILVGVVFYAVDVLRRPGSFDLWGASHQIFHVCVVIGIAIHLCSIFKAFEWNYVHQRCEWT
ncbi:mPR-like GPCR protein [Lophiotrema nucula]|uniref:MPR-like GPCR protein n=1 Tax=Lophiotrema nucula TaxID=690887 RepID=A0A6A5YNV3_9PLEO|nr:mPR-like GPCR protein [Lophiotrema nucula]